MADVGRPTDLTDELIKEINQCILSGKNLKETATEIFNNYANLSEKEKENGLENYIQKLYNWNCENYLKIADKIEGWKRDRKLMLADITSDTIQTLPVYDETGKLDKELLKIKQKESEFIRETLGKKLYSKRSELGGLDGKDLIPLGGFNYVKPIDNSNNSAITEAGQSLGDTTGQDN